MRAACPKYKVEVKVFSIPIYTCYTYIYSLYIRDYTREFNKCPDGNRSYVNLKNVPYIFS